ncbi:MAG: aldehyde dehydrogenase family protein [Candidatus Saliniplasma sp.]
MVNKEKTGLNFIKGDWIECESKETFENRNPADFEDLIGYYQYSDKKDVEKAVKAAKNAQKVWKNITPAERGRSLKSIADRLEKNKEELAEILTLEEGKTLDESTGEVQRAIDIFHYYSVKAKELGGSIKSASEKDKLLYTINEPLGTVGLITPWNYPLAIPSWKMAPALAAGNTIVFKPASLAPESSRKLVEYMEKSNIPAGVINYVTGPGSTVGKAITTHPDIDAVSFTGSLDVGEEVHESAARGRKRVQTEMGGKNPTVVMESAVIDKAVNIVKDGAFGVTGQACTATSRAIVHEKIYDDFLSKLIEKVEDIEVGPGLENPDMGPQVSEKEVEGTLHFIKRGLEEGAILETGGNRLDKGNFSEGYFIEPTVFSDVKSDMTIAQKEIFGPVLSVLKVHSFEEAIKVANSVRYGLSASIVTNDLFEANRFVNEIEAGVVKINEKTTGLELHVPFGGLKESSSKTWREQGDAALDFYTISKTVYMNY